MEGPALSQRDCDNPAIDHVPKQPPVPSDCPREVSRPSAIRPIAEGTCRERCYLEGPGATERQKAVLAVISVLQVPTRDPCESNRVLG